MSRIPKFIVGGISFIVALSIATRYSYLSTHTDATSSPITTASSGLQMLSSNTTLGEGGVVESAVEGAKNYWNVVMDKYNSISTEVSDWARQNQDSSAGIGRSPVSLEERQRASEVWKAVEAVGASSVNQPKSEALVQLSAPVTAGSITLKHNPATTAQREIAGASVSSPAGGALNPAAKHVANSFAAAKEFLNYGKEGIVVTNPVPVTPVAPSPVSMAGGPPLRRNERPAAKEKGNKRLAKTEPPPEDKLPPSTDPPINYELVKKYSQRAYYKRNYSTSLQKMDDENDFPKLHVCVNAGEAYGAAWLATRRHLIYGGVNQFNLTWVNCEMASFTVMGNFRRVMKPTGMGVIMQSLDVLDLSVLHLSTFERSHKRYQAELWPDRRIRKVAWHNIDPIVQASLKVEKDVKERLQYGKKEIVWPEYAKRTIVVMPFLGGAMGAGHSVLSNRYHYLRACFWSIYESYPYIVMAVTQQSDVTWGKEQSEMPWYDVVLLENLPKSASLPMATVQFTRRMLLSKTWDFDYVYYTESDQILMMRNPESYHKYLDAFPLRVMVPHRLMVYSDTVMGQIHKRTKKSPDPMERKEYLDLIPTKNTPKRTNLRYIPTNSETLNDWRKLSCCMPRQNCMERESWIPVNKPNGVPLLNYSGLIVPLGNSNFLLESYRSCIVQEPPLLGERSYCP